MAEQAPQEPAGTEALRADLAAARVRLKEMEYLLGSIQSGQADALVIHGPRGEQVFTLKSLDVLVDSIIDNSLGASLLVDGDGVILRASAQANALAGEDPRGREFGRALPIILSGEGHASGSPLSIRSVLDGSALDSREGSLSRPDGTTLHLLVAAKPLTAFGGLFRGAVIHLQDITDRKSAELQLMVRNKQLRYQSELTRTITDNTVEALFLTDADGRIVFMNPSAEQLVGAPLADLVGRTMHEAVHPQHAGEDPASAGCPLERLLSDPQGDGSGEDTFTRADGGLLSVRYSKSPVINEDKSAGAVLSVGDITQRNATEAALRLSEEKLRQSQKMEAVGRLAGGIAHDFNNLLTSINGYSALALQDKGLADHLRTYMEEIHKAGERAASLTSQLLAYSRKQILAPKVVDMNDLVRDTMAILRRTLGEDLRYEEVLDASPCRVKADPMRIQQVIMNLAINARDAMPRGGRLRVETGRTRLARGERTGLVGEMAREEEGLPPGEYVRVSVEDDGQGMDEGVKARLFEPFFTTKEVGKGTGLGLSMAYGILKQSHGSIQVFSEPGLGTRINILLPASREEPARPASAPAAGRHSGKETVLVVEDEETVLGLIRRVLTGSGYHVLEARSGAEALALAAAHAGPIDLLITDMVMNGMGGHELSETLRRSRPETRRIFISGYTDDFFLRSGTDGRDFAFLQKPFSPETLAGTVRRSLDAPVAAPR